MIRTDRWLLENAELLGIDPANINPASVDVALGSQIIEVFYDHKYDRTVEIKHVLDADNPELTMLPNRDYLVYTLEKTYIPPDHAVDMKLKSRLTRQGVRMNVGWGDPGFNGQWTTCLSVNVPVTLSWGMRFAQLVFISCDTVPEEDYGQTGNYQNSEGIQVAK